MMSESRLEKASRPIMIGDSELWKRSQGGGSCLRMPLSTRSNGECSVQFEAEGHYNNK